MDTISGYSGKSYEKIVHKKDPGNDPQCAPCAPFMFRTIVKRHAMTGSRLGRYAETGQPPYFSGDGKNKIAGSK